MSLILTPVFVVVLVLFNLAFLMPSGPCRAELGIAFWGGEERLDRLVRGHGSFVEVVPLFLAALATAEFVGVVPWLLWTCGGLMSLSRLLHYLAVLGQVNAMGSGRLLGTLLTMSIMLVLAIAIGWRLLV